MERYKELRNEFKGYRFRERLKKCLPVECAVCGCKENIEYHHIVPLRLGGTNSFRNIIPLCHDCHEKAHGSLTIRKDYSSKDTGRKRKVPNEEAERALKFYFLGLIGKKRAEEMLCCDGKYSKLNDRKVYKEFKEKHGIVRHRNLIDTRSANSKDNGKPYIVSEVCFDDGGYYVLYSNDVVEESNDALEKHGLAPLVIN